MDLDHCPPRSMHSCQILHLPLSLCGQVAHSRFMAKDQEKSHVLAACFCALGFIHLLSPPLYFIHCQVRIIRGIKEDQKYKGNMKRRSLHTDRQATDRQAVLPKESASHHFLICSQDNPGSKVLHAQVGVRCTDFNNTEVCWCGSAPSSQRPHASFGPGRCIW